MRTGRTIRSLFFCALLIGTVPASAGTCSSLLARVKGYFQEVRDTKGLRLLAKPAQKDEPVERFYGFLAPSGRPSPFHGLGLWLIDKPTNATIRAFAGPDKQASLLAKFPAIIGWALLTQVYVIDPVTEYAYDQRVQSEVERYRGVFDEMIQTDYRFEPLRKALAEKRMTVEEAERQAYMLSRAYSSYYKFRDGKKAKFTPEDNEGLLTHYLFSHLKPIMDGEFEVPQGFRATPRFRAHLDGEQKQQLFKLTHALYLEYQLVESFVQNRDPDLTLSIRQSPFTHALERLRDEGRITTAQLRRALQEHAFWDYRLKTYAVMGLEKIHPDNGRPATLADYDAEILADF